MAWPGPRAGCAAVASERALLGKGLGRGRGLCEVSLRSPPALRSAGVAGGGGGGGSNDFQWCFSQVKGAIDEDVAEGKGRATTVEQPLPCYRLLEAPVVSRPLALAVPEPRPPTPLFFLLSLNICVTPALKEPGLGTAELQHLPSPCPRLGGWGVCGND